MKKISLIIFYLIKLVHNFFLILFKKNLFIHFKELFEKYLITNLKIKDKQILLFTPNHSSFWRANQFLIREPDTIEWIESFNENTNFWDIGACVGQFSIFSCKFKNTDVICFEPSTSNLRILSRNIFLNNLQKKIKIFPIALNDYDTFSLFNEHKFVEAGALNTVVRDNQNKDYENQYNIFSITINTLVTKHSIKKPNYIKIDVDGKEYDTTGRQEGDQTFVVDPRPDSETQGQFINTSEIDNFLPAEPAP